MVDCQRHCVAKSKSIGILLIQREDNIIDADKWGNDGWREYESGSNNPNVGIICDLKGRCIKSSEWTLEVDQSLNLIDRIDAPTLPTNGTSTDTIAWIICIICDTGCATIPALIFQIGIGVAKCSRINDAILHTLELDVVNVGNCANTNKRHTSISPNPCWDSL